MRRRLFLAIVAAGALALAASWLPLPATFFPSGTTHVSEAAAPEKPAENAPAPMGFSALPARASLGAPRGALFAPPPAPPKPAPLPVVEAKPTSPPLPYRVAGVVSHDGARKIVLVKGDQVLAVAEGDDLDGGYRVEAVSAEDITLLYAALGTRERLPLAAAAGGRAPPGAMTAAAGGSQFARLRWEGPQRVQAGASFNVSLKVTSREPLHASPLQITYDPQLLQPVAARAGSFFGADGFFSYRIMPSGSIFVTASGRGGEASDAELLVLTFKPLRPAAAAELKLASLALQGEVGRPIAFEPPSEFRASITP